MEGFAELLDRLVYTSSRNTKVELISQYFRATGDPDRGWALSALTDGLPFRLPMRKALQIVLEPRVDPVLFRLSHDYVGDTAETVALLWPEGDGKSSPTLSRSIMDLKSWRGCQPSSRRAHALT